MNKVILMGRLTKDPEIRYGQGSEPLAIARYSLAVNRRIKREGEADADFINCVVFGKGAEFAEKYFKKGQLVAVEGRLSVRQWEDNTGQKRWTTEVVLEQQYFAESKGSSDPSRSQRNDFNPPAQRDQMPQQAAGFFEVEEGLDDDDLPF